MRFRQSLLVAAVLALAGCVPRPAPEPVAFEPDSVADAYRFPSGALFFPGTTRAWQVTADGDLYNGAWRLRITPAAGGGAAAPPRRIAAEDRWLPVLHWTRRSAGVRWDFSAAALPAPAPRDSQLLVSLEIRARNTGSTPVDARLDLALDAGGPHPAFAAWDATDEPPRWGGGGGSRVVHAWASGAAETADFAEHATLAPGETRVTHVVLPAYPTREGDLAAFARSGHAASASRVRDYWRSEVARGIEIAAGDPELENALRAATVVLLSCRERRGPHWVPIGGPFQYRDVWLRDGARAIVALTVAGQTEAARQLADGFLMLQWPTGAFLSQRGQLDGTGQAMWAIGQALLRPAPPPDVARFAEAAYGGFRWCELERLLGPRVQPHFAKLLPFAEPRDGELTRAQLVGNDAWAIAGYRELAALLAAAGRPVERSAVIESLAAYQADFVAALAESSSPDLPPSWQGPGRDWGNFAVPWPCLVLPPGDRRNAAFAARVWRAGGGAGLTFYATPDSLHGYLGADLGVWALLTGRRGAADSVLAAHLAWRSASGGAGELFTRADGDFGLNLPPHPTSAAALWMLARNSLIYDDDDTLRLTLGARERWWRRAVVRRAPTRWGLMDLSFSRTAAHARWTWTATPVWTALTLPPGTHLAATPAAPLRGDAGGTRVWAPPRSASAEVAIAEDGRP